MDVFVFARANLLHVEALWVGNGPAVCPNLIFVLHLLCIVVLFCSKPGQNYRLYFIVTRTVCHPGQLSNNTTTHNIIVEKPKSGHTAGPFRTQKASTWSQFSRQKSKISIIAPILLRLHVLICARLSVHLFTNHCLALLATI